MQGHEIATELDLGDYQKYYRPNAPVKFFLSFNIWALFFGPLWFCYRKMIGVGVALYAVNLVMSAALYFSPLVPAYVDKGYLFAIDIFCNLVFCFFANWIYMKHIAKWRKKKQLEKLTGFKYVFIGFLIMLLGVWAPYGFTLFKMLPYKQQQLLSIMEQDNALSIGLYKHLLKKNLKLEEKDESGETLVFNAVKKNHINQLKYFSEVGANLEEPNNIGIRPIDLAAFQGHKEIVEFLIEKGVDFHSERLQLTPLMGASYSGNLEIVKLLVANGVNVNYASKEVGYTAWDLASARGNVEIADYLKQQGAKNNKERGLAPLKLT